MSIRIALAGNPNCGKTTLFNALTGSNQYVGNWPGVTVEKKEGRLKSDKDVIITDLPGIYSLSPYTLEEVVARNYIIDEKPDAVLNIIDGTNLERNLYLTTQVLELGVPVVVAVNMMDIVEKNGDKLNLNKLSEELGVPVVSISALKNQGIDEAIKIMIQEAKSGKILKPKHSFSGAVEHAFAHIEELCLHDQPESIQRWYAIKLFERDANIQEKLKLSEEKIAHIEHDITEAEDELDDDAESIITTERYNYIGSIIDGCVKKAKRGMTTSDKIDQIVTNRFLALPIFAGIMFLVYYISIVAIGTPLTDFVNDNIFGDGFNFLGNENWFVPSIPMLAASGLEAIGVASWLEGLIVDGIIAGVGAVLGFLPQMLVFFICLAFLEGCGYMSRIAFILDRVFRKFGLSGKSFIPILIGTGCGVPGILGSRTIEDERDRRMTIMTTTFIPCSAKLPIIAMIAGAFFDGSAWVATSAYFVGMAAIICSGIILKKTKLFAGEATPFVMELPAYHMPTAGSILHSMWERGSAFVKKAGSIVLLSTIVVWFLMNFGWVNGSFGMLDAVEIDHSILAALGNAISWIFIPLGFGNWAFSIGAITGLVAKENLVATLGMVYGFAEVSEEGAEFWGTLSAALSPIAAYSFLLFNLLCAPCFAAMGAIRREMNSGKWFAIAIGYQCGLAWLVAMVVYQFGGLITGVVSFNIWTVIAAAVTLAFIYLLFRKNPQAEYMGQTVRA